MKNSTTSNWYVNLMFVILTAAAMFLIGVTFTAGKGEGQHVKESHEQLR